jgi:hypothetical protein
VGEEADHMGTAGIAAERQKTYVPEGPLTIARQFTGG